MTAGNPDTGDELGPFRIGRRLGVGGMGVVFEALDNQLNRRVALKIISPHLSDDQGFRARFTREARAQALLDSPHVVQVYSFGEADGRLYIASQLIPDGDLGEMLQRHGSPPPRVAINLMSQVADGLSAAHEAGLIHRDIKPGNVLLRRRDAVLQAYLGDFGIARRVGSDQQMTVAGGTIGTPSYMAPELHTGGEAATASDIYSLGCLLWATLHGSAPYAGSSDYQIVVAHVEQPVPQLAETGPLAAEVNRTLRNALAKQPSGRYPTAADMRDDLRWLVRLPDDVVPLRARGLSDPTAPSGPRAWGYVPSRTPTPTPSGGPPQAPPAPLFRTPSGPTPQFVHHTTASGRRPGRSRGRLRLWLVLAVVVVVLGVGIGLTIAMVVGG